MNVSCVIIFKLYLYVRAPDHWSLREIDGLLVRCLYDDILILGKSPIKWRLSPDMTLAVDWDVKYQFKQTFLYVP